MRTSRRSRSPGRRFTRALAKTAAVLLALAILLVLAVFLLTGTEWGTRLTVEGFLGWYNSVIPGEMSVAKVSGTLVGGARFRGVALLDREGKPVVEADGVDYRILPARLLSGIVHATSVRVEGARVTLRTYGGESAFVDLGPRETGEAVSEDSGAGRVVLPITVTVDDLLLERVVLLADDGRPEDLLSVPRLMLRGSWTGGEARYRIEELQVVLPEGTLAVRRLDAVATLEEGRIWRLTHARAETDRGSVEIPEARFDLNTLNGGASLSISSQTSLFSDLMTIPKKHPLSAELQVALEGAARVGTTGHVTLATASLSFDGSAKLGGSPAAEAAFTLQGLNPGLLGVPIEGSLGGEGEVHLAAAKQGRLAVSGTLTGKACTIDRIGALSLDAEGSFIGTEGSAKLSVGGRGISVASEVSIDEARELRADWRLRADSIRPLGDLIPLRGARGSVSAEGHCRGDLDAPSCRFSVTARELGARDIAVKSLEGSGRIALREGELSLSAESVLRGVRAAKLVLREVELSVSKGASGYRVGLNAAASRSERLALDGAVRTGDAVRLDVEHLESTLGRVAVRLLAPAALTLRGKRISVGRSGLDLRVGQGRVSARGGLSDTRLSNVRVRVDDLDLGLAGRFVEHPKLAGIVDADIEAAGPLHRPRISVTATARNLAVQASSPHDLEIRSRLTEDRLDFDVRVRRAGASLVEASGTLPARLDLRSPRITWLDDGDGEMSWKVHRFSSRDLLPFVVLPEGLEFAVSGRGSLVYRSMKDLRLEGRVDGWLRERRLGRVPLSADLDIASNRQRVRLDATGRGNLALEANLTAGISIPALLDGVLDMEESRIEISFGQGRLEAWGSYSATGSSRLGFALTRADLGLAELYLEDSPFAGIIDAEGDVVYSPEALDMSLRSAVSRFAYRDLRVGDGAFQLLWKDEVAAFEVGLTQKGRRVLDASGEVPVAIDPSSFEIAWLRAKPHALRWRSGGLDLKPFYPRLASKAIGLGAVESRGAFRGTLGGLRGSCEVKTVSRPDRIEEIPLVLGVKVNGATQHLTLHLGGRSAYSAEASVESRADLEALIDGTQTYETVPIKASFEARDSMLSLLNVFDLAPLYDISGSADASLRLEGSSSNPRLDGRLRIRNGEVSLGSLTDPLTDISADIRFTENTWQMKNLSMKSGEGVAAVAANGVLSKDGRIALLVAAKSRKFRMALSGLPVFTLDADTSAEIHASRSGVDIKLKLEETALNHVGIQQSSVKPIPRNDNLRVIEREAEDEPPGEHREASTDAPPVRLSVATVKPLRVFGASLDTAWRIGIQTTVSEGDAHIRGEAVLDKGSFDLFANTFTIDKASAFFTDKHGVDPHISVLATSELPDAKVFVRIDGTVGSPRLRVYSEPAMSEEAIFAMLVSGSSEESVKGSSVIAGVVQMKYPVVTNLLYNKFGIDRVSIGSSASGSGTVVKLGQRVSDKLFFYTAFNLSPAVEENDYEMIFEYSLTDKLTLDTMSGNESSALDLGWRIPIGKRKRKRPR